MTKAFNESVMIFFLIFNIDCNLLNVLLYVFFTPQINGFRRFMMNTTHLSLILPNQIILWRDFVFIALDLLLLLKWILQVLVMESLFLYLISQIGFKWFNWMIGFVIWYMCGFRHLQIFSELLILQGQQHFSLLLSIIIGLSEWDWIFPTFRSTNAYWALLHWTTKFWVNQCIVKWR